MRLVRTVSPQHFAPPPKVDSAILAINRRKKPLIATQHQPKFRALAAYGLRDPRLPLFASLAGVFTPPQITKLVRVLGVDRELPIGRLNEEQWGLYSIRCSSMCCRTVGPNYLQALKGNSKRE